MPAPVPEQAILKLPEPAAHPAEPAPTSAPEFAAAPEIQLLSRTARRGEDPLEALTWPAGYSPTCPMLAHPTTGLEEHRVVGIWDPVIAALAQPCGCLVDEHVVPLHGEAARTTALRAGIRS
jgi:hypothetical protein